MHAGGTCSVGPARGGGGRVEFETAYLTPADDADIQLHTQVYAPAPSGAGAPTVLAIVTHPYGALGGDMRNPVVQGLALQCAQKGFVTVKLDFRGAGKSSGAGTWRAHGEAEDLVAAVEHYSRSPVFAGRQPKLVFVGYSFGSVVAGSLLARYDEHLAGYIAVAYPFSVTWFLTLFRTAEVQAPLARVDAPMLFLHGTRDNFSALATVRGHLERLAPKRMELGAVEGADHFFASRQQKMGVLLRASAFLEEIRLAHAPPTPTCASERREG